MTDITVPQLGESVTEATVGSWMVKAGDAVSRDDVLVELETDKVAVEVRADADGVMGEILANEGENVEIGAKLAVLETGGGSAPVAEKAPADEASAPVEDAPKEAADTGVPAEADAMPAASGAAVEATVPQMGESVTEGTIGSWLVKAGDTVEIDQALVEIETDKVAVEVQ